MRAKEQCPAGLETQRGSIINSDRGKDTPKLSNRQRKVLELLKSRKCSAADISIALRYSDPRSYIRDIRHKGICIYDKWMEADGVRYKVYWCEEPEPSQPMREIAESKEQSNFLDLFPKQYNH